MIDEWAAAHRAEISTFPIRSDGSKAPALGSWKPFQSERADDLTVAGWQRRFGAYGWVCGAVSGRLVVFDLEDRFVAECFDGFVEALQAAGLYATVQGWVDGCSVETPSGGLHIAVRVDGDGAVPPNRKLAFDVDGEVLAEWRGEGGYVVGAGSNGHVSGRSWRLLRGGPATVAYVTGEELEAVAGVLAGFDATPSRVPSPPQPPRLEGVLVADSLIERSRGSWPSWEAVLVKHGFVFVRDDPLGPLWAHPGKADRGHSLRINLSGRAYVWSWGFGGVATSEGSNRTFNVGEFDLCCELGREPSGDEFAAWCRRWRPAVVHPGGEVDDGGARRDEAASSTSDSSIWVSDEFWNLFGWTRQLYDVALSRMLSPDAVLGAFLPLYAATIPMAIWFPPVLGVRSPLNIFSVLVGPSGSGKTAATMLALELLGPVADPDILLDESLRSGEGLIALATIPAPPPTKGALVDTTPRFRRAVHLNFDEGSGLSRQQAQNTATHMSYLNSAWSGASTIGGAKREGRVSFPGNFVRITATIGVQYGVAANLFTGSAEMEGFPQRLSFYGTDHPALADVDIETLANNTFAVADPLDVTRYDHSRYRNDQPVYIDVPTETRRQMLTWQQQRRTSGGETLDGHMMLLRGKLASILALADGSFSLDSDKYWIGSQLIETSSRQTRSRLGLSISRQPGERAKHSGELDFEREIGHDAARTRHYATILARHVHNAGDEGIAGNELAHKLRSDRRDDIDEYLNYAHSRGWVIHKPPRYHPGASRPAN